MKKIIHDIKVVFTQRLRLADNEIINLEKSYVPYFLCTKLLQVDLSTESIYNLLTSERYKPSKADEEVQAILSNDELSELLETNVDEPILKRKRITYAKNIPIEYTLNYYRGDVYTMIMTINS